MKNEINLVNLSDNLPINISIINFDTIFRHIHTWPQLLLILEGECDIYLENNVYHAKENDMILINKQQFHHLISKDGCILISTLIDVNGFLSKNEKDDIFFNLNTIENKDNPRYNTIRYLIYSLISYNSMENINSIYTNRAIAYSFFAQLVNDFKVTSSISSKEIINTINQITAYLNDHYNESISLSFLSNKFNYSDAYLSRLFKSTYNQSFIDYYDNLRVNYSLNDLLLSDKTINEISKTHGFEDVRSYVRAFKKINDVTPSEYREKYKNKTSNFINIDKKLLKKQTLDKILAARENEARNNSEKHISTTRDTEVFLNIDLKAKTNKMVASSKTILEVNGPSDLLNEIIIENIKMAKKDFGLTYIKVPHLLGRETHLLRKNEDDEWTINFVFFSTFINKILSLNAIPYLVFELNEYILNKTQFYALVLSILQYMSLTFKDKLNNLLISFSFYRDASTYINPSLETYFYLYQDLYLETKKRMINAKIGTPFFFKDDILLKKDYFNFLKLCEKYEINYDFIPIKYTYTFFNEENLSKNKHEMRDFIQFLKNNNGFKEGKIYLEGINFTTSNNNLLNDTIYSSSYLIQNFINNVDDIASFSKNSFIDRDSVSAYDQNPFHGENGMLTYNNIKKASYNSFVFLGKLENNIIEKNENYIVTSSKDKIVILLNNYTHYSDLYADKEYYQISNTSRYDCFPKSTNVNYKIVLNNLFYSSIKIKISSISKESGSSYDKWLSLGANKSLSEDEVSILKGLSEISYFIETKSISENKYTLDINISPLESKLIEINLI